ncbi:MAG: efflux RND transporter permease subunit, partial [Desulfosalsimonas sp.]
PYRRTVDIVVRWRYAAVACSVALLMLTWGLYASGKVKFNFFPKVEGDVLECMITMPSGTPVERTRQLVDYVEKAAEQMIRKQEKERPEDAPPVLEHTASIIGAQFTGRGDAGDTGGHLAHVFVQLLESEKRGISSAMLNDLWRRQVGEVPDAESLVFKSDIHSAGSPVEVHLSADDNDLLLEAADELKAELEEFSGVYDIADSFLPGKQEMQIDLKPAAAQLGIGLEDLAFQVRSAFYGVEALRFQRDRNEIKVLVRYPEQERRSLENVEQMRIRTPDGHEVPFSEAARVRMESGYSKIERAQRRRVIKVTADVDENITNAAEVRSLLEGRFLPQMKNRYEGLRYTIEGEGQEQKQVLGDVKKGFIIALFCIYALLAVPFRSFSQPIVVMCAIPFGMMGAVGGHMALGYNITMMSLLGMVGLAGVVVNDSLVLVDRINQLRRKQAMGVHESVILGGKLRFRAVVLTSITTFGGLTPMMLEQSIQARFLIPMAISLGFGVLFATFVTLLLVPCGYVILDDIHRVTGRVRKNWSPLGCEAGD